MITYTPNIIVELTFDIPSGNVSGVLGVYDELDNQLGSTALTTSDLNADTYTAIISSLQNDLGTATKGVRTVELKLVDDHGVIFPQVQRYYLMVENRLQRGVNSTMSFAEALLLVPDVTKLEGWHAAESDTLRRTALIEAYESMKQFPLNIDNYRNRDITELTASELEAIDSRMLAAFQKAQLLQADYLLGGDAEKQLRDAGVISRSVGESTNFFRTTKVLNYGITDRAYHCIVRYISRTIRLKNA